MSQCSVVEMVHCSKSTPLREQYGVPHERTQLSHVLQPRLRFANVVDHESVVSPFHVTGVCFASLLAAAAWSHARELFCGHCLRSDEKIIAG